MVITLFKISLLLPQIILGILFSWKVYLMEDLPDNIWTNKRRVCQMMSELLLSNYLIWGHTLSGLLLANKLSLWHIESIISATCLIRCFIGTDIRLALGLSRDEISDFQEKLWRYAILFVRIMIYFNFLFFAHEMNKRSRAKDQELAAMTDELYRLKKDRDTMKREIAESEQEKISLRNKENKLLQDLSLLAEELAKEAKTLRKN